MNSDQTLERWRPCAFSVQGKLWALIGASLILALQGSAWAKSKSAAQQWNEQMVSIHDDLLEQKWRAAELSAKRLVGVMADSIIEGSQTGLYLGRASVMRALALAGQKKTDEALWQWHVACQLLPGFSKSDLSRYGAAGELLRSSPPRNRALFGCKLKERPEDDCNDSIEQPRLKRRIEPRFPRAQKGRSPKVVVEVEAIIGKDGQVRSPVLLSSEGEVTFVYAVFEAMQRWKFEPALKNGEPVQVYFTLTVSFVSRS